MGLNFMPPPCFLEVVILILAPTGPKGYSRGESVPHPHSPTKHYQVSHSSPSLPSAPG